VLSDLGQRDDGQLTLLVIGYLLIVVVLVTVGIDVSKVFLAQRALSSAADAAALQGAQAIDRAAVYGDAAGPCDALLPLDQPRASDLVDASVRDAADILRNTFVALDPPATTVAAGTVSVRLSGDVALPFARVVALLDAALPDGRVHVVATAHAQAPLSVPGGC
jgi:uncharacterized membrane protein